MENRKQKALVTGYQGFIGSHLYDLLLKENWEVDGLDLKKNEDIRYYNFTNNYDIIFHLAANASIPQSIKNPIASHEHNVIGTLRVLEYAKKTGARIVFSSSSSIYGEPSEIPTSEKCPANPMIPYAVQKLESEMYMKLYWQLYGVKSVALRYMNVFGERQEIANGGGDSALALGNFLKQYKENKPFTIVGNGEQRRDFIYADDVARANIKAGEWLKTSNNFEIFNIGSGINYSINEVCNMISKDHPKINLSPRVEPRFGLADITKAKTVLNWHPNVSLKDWIDRVR